ncbi:MAG: hypothetical protein AAGH46_09205 [Bacteroidota bacterium]
MNNNKSTYVLFWNFMDANLIASNKNRRGLVKQAFVLPLWVRLGHDGRTLVLQLVLLKI